MKMQDVLKLAATPEELAQRTPQLFPGLFTRIREDVTDKELDAALLKHCRHSYEQNQQLSGADVNYKTPHVNMSTCKWR